MKAILIGYGEIGNAVYQVFKEKHEIDIYDLTYQSKTLSNHYDIMLVTIPYSAEFVKDIKDYQEKFNPQATLVFSSVAIGTCSQIDAVHSPVEGKHPNLAESIQKGKRFIGGLNHLVNIFVKECIPRVLVYSKPEITEFLKLRSTSLYGVNIEFARYTNEVCKILGIPYGCANEYDKAYNNLYKELGMPEYQRYILTPPEGAKGGHCVTPNAKILNEQFPHELLDIVSEKEIYESQRR